MSNVIPVRSPRDALRRRIHCITFVLVMAGLGWRTVRYLLAFPIWGDEAFVAVNFVTRDFAGMFRPLDYGQIVPLLFMWAELVIVRMCGLSELALRALPFLVGVVSLLLFWRLSFQVLPTRAAFLATGILAAAYYPVRHAAEVKPYATDFLVALVLLVLTLRVLKRPRSALTWAGLIFGLGAAVWASYPSAFIGCTIVSLLLYRAMRSGAAADANSRMPLAAALGAALIFGASGATMYFTYAQPHAEAAARLTEINMWTETFPPLTKFWLLPLWSFQIHTGNMLAYPIGGKAPASIATLALVITAAIAIGRRRPALIWLLLGPLLFTFVAAALEKYPYGGSARTSLYMAPAFCLLAGHGLYVALKRLAPLRHRWLVYAPAGLRKLDWRATPAMLSVALLLIAICGVGVYRDVREPARSPEVARSREVVRQIAARTTAQDRWIVFNATTPVDYAPYLGDWMGVGGQWVFDVLRFAPVRCDWAPQPSEVNKPAGRVILLAYEYSGKKAAFPETQLETYLRALTARLGEPTSERTIIKEKRKAGEPPQVEAQRVYFFGE